MHTICGDADLQIAPAVSSTTHTPAYEYAERWPTNWWCARRRHTARSIHTHEAAQITPARHVPAHSHAFARLAHSYSRSVRLECARVQHRRAHLSLCRDARAVRGQQYRAKSEKIATLRGFRGPVVASAVGLRHLRTPSVPLAYGLTAWGRWAGVW